jgi:hypothetical protein
MEKMYIVVRNDLKPGLQIAQAVHAAIAFALTYEEGENVVVLQAPDEQTVSDLVTQARRLDYQALSFSEPDLGGQVTAGAFGGEAKRLLSTLALALRTEVLPGLLDEAYDHVDGELDAL